MRPFRRPPHRPALAVRTLRPPAPVCRTCLPTGRTGRRRAGNKNCSKDGAFLDKSGQCHSPRHGETKGKSVNEGYKGRCTRQEAEERLNAGMDVRGSDGRNIRFDRFARDHYRFGLRRKDNIPKPENLEYLPVAVFAVRHGTRTLKFPRGTTPDYLNPPRGTQAVYSLPFEGSIIRVYAYADTGLVSGWHVREGAKK